MIKPEVSKMKHGGLLLVVLLWLIPIQLGSQSKHKAPTPAVSSSEEIAKSIQHLESDLRIATMKGEASWFEEHLAASFIDTDANGKVSNRAEIIQLYRTAAPEYDAWNLSEGTAQTFHGNTVVLTGKLEVQAIPESKSVSGTFRFTRVWIKNGLDWQLAAQQMTRIAG
jgi:hypothetical protein